MSEQAWLASVIVLVPLLSSVIPVVASLRYDRVGWWVAATSLGVTFALTVRLVAEILAVGTISYEMGGVPAPFGVELYADAFSGTVLLLDVLMALGVLAYTRTAGPRGNAFYPIRSLLGSVVRRLAVSIRLDRLPSGRDRFTGLTLRTPLQLLEIRLQLVQTRGLRLLVLLADQPTNPVLERLQLLFDPRFRVVRRTTEVVPSVLEVFAHIRPLAKDRYNRYDGVAVDLVMRPVLERATGRRPTVRRVDSDCVEWQSAHDSGRASVSTSATPPGRRPAR